VAVRLRAHGGAVRLPRPHVRATGGRPRPRSWRDVAFASGVVRAAVHRRDELGAGARIRGPAIVCEYSATTLVPPGWSLRVDRTGGLVLSARHAPR
jgi:N-methylhydantoinase A